MSTIMYKYSSELAGFGQVGSQLVQHQPKQVAKASGIKSGFDEIDKTVLIQELILTLKKIIKFDQAVYIFSKLAVKLNKHWSAIT